MSRKISKVPADWEKNVLSQIKVVLLNGNIDKRDGRVIDVSAQDLHECQSV